MGLLRHAKQLVKDLYPHAANFLGRGAMKVAEGIQRLGVPSGVAEKVLDTILENIPTTEQVIRGGKLALDMYGEFRNNSGIGFISGTPPVGGIKQNIEYPGYYTRTGQSGLGGGFGKGKKHPKEIFEYGQAFPGSSSMQSAADTIRSGIARGDHVYMREEPTVAAPTRAAPPPPTKVSEKIKRGIARGDHIYTREEPPVAPPARKPPAPRATAADTKRRMEKQGSTAPITAKINTKVPSKPPKSIRMAMGEEPKKKKKQRMITAI